MPVPLTELKPYWADPRMFATSLLTLYWDCYVNDEVGLHEVLNWHPATIQMEIEQDFGVDLPATNYDKLLTALNLINTNTFYTSTADFLRACVVLAGHEVNPSHMILPDAAELAWGITEGMLIMPPDDNDESPFQPEITAYIGHVLDSEGILNPPDVLRIATRNQELVDRVNYDYSDDPEMFSSISKVEGDKTNDINTVIRGRMVALIHQLDSLPLRQGKFTELAQRMLSKLPGGGPLPLPT